MAGRNNNFIPAKKGEIRNPAGKPKGTKHIAHWIQELMNDEEFTIENFMFEGKQWKGAPIKAIITVATANALQGDVKWAEWLGKYGYGQKVTIASEGENSGGQTALTIPPELITEFTDFIKRKSVTVEVVVKDKPKT